MKYSNTAVRELSAKYRSILKKCAFLNAIVIMGMVFEANATDSWVHPNIDSYSQIDEDVNYTVSGENYNIFTGTGMRNIINGDVTLTMDGGQQNGTVEINGVYGNAFFTSSSISGFSSIGDDQKTLRQYVDGDVSVIVKNNAIVDRNVIGNQFYTKSASEITGDIGLSGKTNITIDNSIVKGDVRGANIGDGTLNDINSKLKVHDIEININNSLVEDEVVAVGAYLSAGDVKINITGNSIIGYNESGERAVEDEPATKPTADGWIIAGTQRSGGTVGNTEINLNTLNDKSLIKIAGDVQVGSRQHADEAKNSDIDSVKGNATLNMLGGGRIDIGGDVRAYHVAGTTALNISNVTANIGGNIANEFDSVTLHNTTLTAGNIAFKDTATLTADLMKSTIVAGSVIFGENNTLNLIVANGVVDDDYDFITASTLTGTEKVKFTDNALYNLSWAGETGAITLAKKSTSEVVSDLAEKGVGSQQAATISAFADSKAGNPILSAITEAVQSGDAKAAAKLAEEVAPTTSQTVMGVAQGVNSILNNVAGTRMAAVGRNGGDAFVGGAMWVQGLLNHTKQDSTSNAAGFSADTNGISFGIDGKVNENLMIGIGYGYTNTDADSGARDIDVDGHNFFAYTEYKPNKWYINGMFNYGFSKYDEQKVAGLQAKYDVNTYAANVMTGYDFDSGITPEVGLRYLLADQESYNDGVQRISTDKADVLTGVVGVKYKADVKAKDWTFTPNLRLAATYDMVSDKSKANVNVIGGGNYQITGDRLERFGVETGVGIETTYKDWNFSVDYNGGFRKDFQSHTGMLKAKYNF